MEILLVGGAVRDQLLGLPVVDRDWVVVGTTPAQMRALGYQQVGKDFPVFLHPQTKEEYALARTERKSGKGYTGFVCHSSPDVTLEDDLLRRDLTINAMAKNESGELIDPYGGQSDLAKRQLRHVSIAFVEDPLRILRIARLHAYLHHLGFKIAEETQVLLREMLRHEELKDLSIERVWSETAKALQTPNPHIYFLTLRKLGALHHVFPEIDAVFGIPSAHPEQPDVDTGIFSLNCLERMSTQTQDIGLRFNALIAKLDRADLNPSHLLNPWPDPQNGTRTLAHMITRLKLPHRFTTLAALFMQNLGALTTLHNKDPESIITLLERLDAYRRPDRFEHFLMLFHVVMSPLDADQAHQTTTTLRSAYAITQNINVQALPKKDLQGKAIGEAIRKLRIQKLRTSES